jgi:hypothetical protein
MVLLLGLAACGPSYTADDTTSNTIAARNESHQLSACATDDASTCTPAYVRSSSEIAFCANARELLVHSAPVPEAGVTCPAATK